MSDQERGKPVNILLVEDSASDVRLTLEVFKEAKVKNTISVVEDGVEAMAYLKKEGKYQNVVRPDLILLDLKLPRKDGREVLHEIKSDEQLQVIPVVILTTSQSEADILKTYRMHANCYITKPVDLNQFIMVVNSIENFWLTIVKLPG